MNIFIIISFAIIFIVLFILFVVAYNKKNYVLFMNSTEYSEILLGSLFGGIILGHLRNKILNKSDNENMFFILFFSIAGWMFISKLLINVISGGGSLLDGEFYIDR